MDTMNLLGRAISLGSHLKAYEISETNRFFSYEWFVDSDKMQNTNVSPHDGFHSKLHGSNLLEAEYNDYVDLLKSGITTEQLFVKLKI